MASQRCLLGAASIFLLLASTSLAQVTDEPMQPDKNHWLQLMPALASAPAPTWVKPGVRITYRTATAMVVGAGAEWVEDPNGYMCPDGIRRVLVPRRGNGAAGVQDVTVLGVDRGLAGIELAGYTWTNFDSGLMSTGIVGFVEPAGVGVDYWVNPDVLAQLPNQSNAGLTVARTDYVVREKNHHVVWIRSQAAGFNEDWVYDAQSGLLLHWANCAEHPHDGVVDTFLSNITLTDGRQLKLPWTGSRDPAWVAGLKAMHYGGAEILPGSALVAPQISTSQNVLDCTGGASGCLRFKRTVISHQGAFTAPVQCEQVSGPATIGGRWISPDALAQLRTGQQIDTEPVTGIVTSVGKIGAAPNGEPTVDIIQECEGFKLDSVYSMKTGALFFSQNTNKWLGKIDRFELQRIE
jgi:hypothetical protein